MKHVYKYDFNDSADTIILNARKVVLIGHQEGKLYPTVWAEHADDGEQAIDLMIFGTGHAVPDSFEHIGSAVCGPFVWHVYKMEGL